ncbi:DUF6207 family protein [Streptomyces sp. NPDC004647]|uniref:DUF6207 family protein n=1 Tax=Streptomyces sp. NPDC004647 TaxID=3154671 RepID=UPI0033B4D448
MPASFEGRFISPAVDQCQGCPRRPFGEPGLVVLDITAHDEATAKEVVAHAGAALGTDSGPGSFESPGLWDAAMFTVANRRIR